MRLMPLVRNRLADTFDRAVSSGWVRERVKQRIVTRERLIVEADRFLRFGDDERFQVRAPISLDPLPEKIQRTLGEHRIEQPFVAELSNIELIGPDAIAVASSGEYILEESLGSIGLLIRSLVETTRTGSLPRRRWDGRDPDIEAAVSLVGPWCRGYYHWFSDYMLRLEGVEHFVEQTGREPTLIVPPDPPSWMQASLELAGFGGFEQVPLPAGRTTIGSLIIPSLRRETEFTSPPQGFTFSPRAYRWLADRVRSNLETEGRSVNVFISRAGAAERHVVNQTAIMEALDDRGFRAYRLEEMRFQDQVKLFANAKTIIGPTGAGLTNMIYAQDANVVTLFGSLVNACYPVLADALDFGNAIMRCQARALDMRADPTKLTELLDRL